MISLKQKLYQMCLSYVKDRKSLLESSIKDIQQSANEETKSSAGDKYETARAMAQLEIDKHQMQLSEVNKMIQDLARIAVEEHTAYVKLGSLIFTSRGNFYIAINAGQQEVDNQTFFTVSSASPIAQKLIGLKIGDTFTLNRQEFTLLKIH
jgi:ElaB/YqjD/DUF883 family membrane-anchored ribosome-binding protein